MTDLPTRDRIKALAGELYVLRGHDGFSFGDLATAIGVTRANIHHHFGGKQRLMEELIEGFATDAEARVARIWMDGEARFADRLRRQVEELRRLHRRFNPRTGDRNVWSPVARLRLDLPVLGAPAAAALERVGRAHDRGLRHALAQAVAAGELRLSTPVADVGRVLGATLLSCGPMTQDSGRFGEVEDLLAALGRTIATAWGPRPG